MTRCIECGKAELLPAVVLLQGTVRGESYVVQISGFECPNCH